ncbi:MAG: single-stranded DNA-binding protein [Clostridia bacterium]|nr:single-stranded DNA-binding protein [Clostridia bacterium]
MNKVILVGNLTRDPELSETPNGVAVCRFSIAVSRDYANSDGTRETDFFNITVWRGRAENCGKYLKKGNKVAVVGSLQNRSYEDKDGIKRNVTDVVASEVEFLTPKSAQSGDSDDAPASTVRRERPQLEAIDDNQLPF